MKFVPSHTTNREKHRIILLFNIIYCFNLLAMRRKRNKLSEIKRLRAIIPGAGSSRRCRYGFYAIFLRHVTDYRRVTLNKQPGVTRRYYKCYAPVCSKGSDTNHRYNMILFVLTCLHYDHRLKLLIAPTRIKRNETRGKCGRKINYPRTGMDPFFGYVYGGWPALRPCTFAPGRKPRTIALRIASGQTLSLLKWKPPRGVQEELTLLIQALFCYNPAINKCNRILTGDVLVLIFLICKV